MIYRVFIVLVFIAVIVGSVLLGGQQREAVSTTTVDEKAADLGYAARQARIIETGPDGHPLYTIDADLINESPGTTQIQLQQARLTFRDTAGHEWTARADTGVAAPDVAKVELSGDVQVSGLLPGSDTQVKISTEKLSVDTHVPSVTTDEPVILTTPGGKLTSKGLSANLSDGVVHLVSSVHGIYSP